MKEQKKITLANMQQQEFEARKQEIITDRELYERAKRWYT